MDKVKETDLVEINDIIYKILKSNKIINDIDEAELNEN